MLTKTSKNTHFKEGDPVYYKNFHKTSMLQNNWRPNFRIIEQKGPVSFIIKDQLSGSTVKAHADQMRLAHIEEWELPKDKTGRVLRKTTYVVPPQDEDSESSEDSSAETNLQKLVKRRRQERDTTADEDDTLLNREIRSRMLKTYL